MFESLGFETLTPIQVALWLGLAIGVSFGVLAQITRFCLRRAIIGEDRQQARGVWAMALAVAVLGTQLSVTAGWINFDAHRFMAADIPVMAIILGGLMFGTGMVLTRGCISRLTVLSGSGNLRAISVIVVFAIVAHAMMKGILAPLRTAAGAVTISPAQVALPGSPWIWTGLLVAAAVFIAIRSENRPMTLLLAALIGALVPLGWVGTGYILFDEFDPIVMESLSFTSSASETLFYTIASTALAPGFGVGLLVGTVSGAAISAAIRGESQWQGFEGAEQMRRYFAGAALMGVGGVLAGGCTVGAGLSGVPTLSIAAILAFLSIIVGGWVTGQVVGTHKTSAITA